jgi:cell surface hyaluronidase
MKRTRTCIMGLRWFAAASTICVLVIIVALRLVPLAQAGQHWSDPHTWNGLVPRAGDHVTIPAGKYIVLDVSPPALASLTVLGTLVVADQDVRLECGEIHVVGELRAGSRWHPSVHRMQIVLDAGSAGRGVLAVSQGGRLTLWGDEHRTWTHLAQTAMAGSRRIVPADAVDWSAGDRIVIAPSGFAQTEAEEETVAAIDRSSIALREPLHFRHWGTTTDGIDERAEVGLLSHTIAITSDDAAASSGVGGQVMVTQGGTLVAHGVEFLHLGVRGQLGKYPVHFHLARDGYGSTVASSSIDHSFNRCLTIHGTNGVTVRDSVAFDAIGHCIFLEDGLETGNAIVHNLVLGTHAAAAKDAILESDAQPASFWITNPSNTIVDNVAAGSDGNGFWFNLSPHPTGPSSTDAVWPRRTALGRFDGNVSHSNENDGLFVDILRNPPGVTEAPNYSPPVAARFDGFTSYKNRRRGAWLRGTDLRLTHATIADNSIGVTFAGAHDILSDSTIVGETANATGDPKPDEPHFPNRGFEFYDGQVGVENTVFVNFVPRPGRETSALSFLRFSPFFSDPTNYARGLTFINAKPVFFEPAIALHDRLGGDGYRATAFRDVDGSVTGQASATVVIASPLIASSDCTHYPDWGADVCQARFGSLFVVAVDGGARNPGPVRIEGAHGSVLLRGNPTPSKDAVFQTNVRAGQTYTIVFARVFPNHVRLGLHHFAPGDEVTLFLPQAPAQSRVIHVQLDQNGQRVVDV